MSVVPILCGWSKISISHLCLLSGQKLIEEGKLLVMKGEEVIDEAQKALNTIPAYNNGVYYIDVSVLGMTQAKALQKLISENQARLSQGRDMIREGNEMVLSGKSLMPHIPCTLRMRKYISKMYRLAQTIEALEKTGGAAQLAAPDPTLQRMHHDRFYFKGAEDSALEDLTLDLWEKQVSQTKVMKKITDEKGESG